MKKIILLVILVAGCGAGVWANDRSASLQAEEMYRAGQYAQALTIYEQDLKNHPKDPFLYYNIGNCYFKMGSKGLATAYYYRAFRLAPRQADIRHNLALSLSDSGETLVPAGVPVVLHKAFFALSLAELKGLVCVLGWLACLLAGCWLLTHRAGKLTLAAAVLLIGCSAWFYVRHSWETQPLAVVASPVAEIRSGPGLNFPVSASVPQGHLLQLVDSKDNWQRVIVRSQGLKGWVERADIEPI